MKKELLKNCRFIAGFTQTSLAEALGISQSTLSKYEKGHLPISKTTKQKVIAVLAEAGLTQDEIYLLSELKTNNK